MARLPSQTWLIQQSGGEVILFEEGTERELVHFPVVQSDGITLNQEGFAQAQEDIDASDLSTADKAWAHFWCGYFWAHAAG